MKVCRVANVPQEIFDAFRRDLGYGKYCRVCEVMTFPHFSYDKLENHSLTKELRDDDIDFVVEVVEY